MFTIRSLEQKDIEAMKKVWVENWGSEVMVTRGKVYDIFEQQGFVAEEEGILVGLLIYRMAEQECEILSLDSMKEGRGVGSALLEKLKEICRSQGIQRIWLVTSNDNTDAMRFYQRRGYDLKAVHRHAITEARKIKSEIPFRGIDDIWIKHEIELEYILE